MVAGVPDWGWPPGSASTTTGLGADPWPGGAGVGSGSGFGSGKATPVFMRTRTPLLAVLQRRSPGLAAPGSGLAASGMTSHGPAAAPSGGAWPKAAQRKVARCPGSTVGSKENVKLSRPPATVVATVACGPAPLPARSWQSAVESVRSRVRSATSTATPSALRVASTSWSAIESLSTSTRTCTPRSARCELPKVLASRLTVSFAAVSLTSHATVRRSALPDAPGGASLGSSRVCTAALAVAGASIRSIARVAMYVRIRTSIRRKAVRKQTRFVRRSSPAPRAAPATPRCPRPRRRGPAARRSRRAGRSRPCRRRR